MKDFFKKLKVGMLTSGLLSLILGIIMVATPEGANNFLRYILGGGLALFGVFEIVSVFVKPNGLFTIGRIVPGVLSLTVGLLLLLRYNVVGILLWTLLGISILIDGIYKMQYAFELKAANIKKWWVNFLVALVSLIMAAVLMIEPFEAAKGMTVFAGILLIFNGLFDLFSIGMMMTSSKQLDSTSVVVITDADKKDQEIVKK